MKIMEEIARMNLKKKNMMVSMINKIIILRIMKKQIINNIIPQVNYSNNNKRINSQVKEIKLLQNREYKIQKMRI